MAGGTVDRRTALGAAAVLTAAAASRVRGANERPNVATIGCGGMGHAHLRTLVGLRDAGRVNLTGVCDVWRKRLDSAAALSGGKPHNDWRRVLDDPEVDAVTIATPDHWHAPMAVAAMEAGKDVYCEKPMTYWADLAAPRGMVEAAERYQRIVQVGTQGMSDSLWSQVAERLRAGAAGKLIHAQASDIRNGPLGVYEPASFDPDAKPGENLDWEMWLGPAPRRAWEPGRFFAFRSFWDYSGGCCTDFFPHILTPLLHTMGLGFPARVSSTGGLYALRDGREIPDIVTATIEYPGGPSVLLVGAVACGVGLPMVIRGHDATVTFEGPGAVIRPEKPVVGERAEETVTRTAGASLEAHFGDWLECLKSRRQPRSPVRLGYACMVALHMAVRSYLEGRQFTFDPATETVRAAGEITPSGGRRAWRR